MSVGGRLLLRTIKVYQAFSAVRPPRCRFLPTCSAYAVEAIVSHGALRGAWYAVCRLTKCRPFGPHGFDPVPPARVRPVGHGAACEGSA